MLTLCVTAAATIPAERQLPRLVDDADLLTDSEETALLSLLDDISTRQQCDVAVVTVDSLDGKSAQAYADDFYDYNGYGMGPGDDGLLLLVAMNDREWHITTYGLAITVFSDSRRERMADAFLGDLSAGYYYDAFTTFADDCDYYLTAYYEDPYDTPIYDEYEDDIDHLCTLLVSLVIGLVIGLISTGVMKSKLKSVRPQKTAANHVRHGSIKITDSREIFLYRNVSRRARPQNTSSSSGGSSVHRSSSGRSHGGGGGRF
ncbi:MAG: TPM domain-containing protein [Clostridia bacterium]|nr:TPM domain-containing protein [Clostridia bacterium]